MKGIENNVKLPEFTGKNYFLVLPGLIVLLAFSWYAFYLSWPLFTDLLAVEETVSSGADFILLDGSTVLLVAAIPGLPLLALVLIFVLGLRAFCSFNNKNVIRRIMLIPLIFVFMIPISVVLLKFKVSSAEAYLGSQSYVECKDFTEFDKAAFEYKAVYAKIPELCSQYEGKKPGLGVNPREW